MCDLDSLVLGENYKFDGSAFKGLGAKIPQQTEQILEYTCILA